MPKFSIVTVSYNSISLLKRTKDSIDELYFRDFEWIVVDGNSNDGTKDFLQTSVSCHNWISEPDRGIADAFNKGIKLAIGEQILLLNCGDIYYPNALDKILPHVGMNFITCASAHIVDEMGVIKGVFKAEPRKLWRGMHLPHNYCSVPRAVYEEFGGYELLTYSMDFDLFHKIYKRNGNNFFKVVDENLGKYLLGGHSDKNYIDSFLQNKKILVNSGMNLVFANLIFSYYIVKHKLSNFFDRRF